MPLSPADQELIADMKQRELHLKRRQRATDIVLFRVRRYRAAWVIGTAVVVAGVVTAIVLAAEGTLLGRSVWWRPALVCAVVGVVLGALLGQGLLRTGRGRRLIAQKESRLREKFSGDLNTGRRWLQFEYRGEDISAYVPQILYAIEGERRFDSVQAALAFAKANRHQAGAFATRALDRFNTVAAQNKLVVISSTDESGRPSSRVMCFVTSDRPGVWYVTTAPEGPKVHEFDRGRIALVTPPTESGATITSNRVRITRLGASFSTVAELYRAQVPGYADGMTDTEQELELVYELTFQSARVETWLEHEVVEFPDPGLRTP